MALTLKCFLKSLLWEGIAQQYILAGSIHVWYRKTELIYAQPRGYVVYPNILKSQDMSDRNGCAALSGHRVDKCKSCVD